MRTKGRENRRGRKKRRRRKLIREFGVGIGVFSSSA
jgi:hypothetical protein